MAPAREAAAELRVRVRKGADPTAERRQERHAAALARIRGPGEKTLRDIIDEFERAVAKPKGHRSWDVRRKHLEAEYRQHLDRPAAELSPAAVRQVLDAAAERRSPVPARVSHARSR